MTNTFHGKSALVTGAASGIGAASAQWLARNGVERLVLVDLDGEALHGLDLPCTVLARTGDVADPAFWDDLEGELETLDHAVINAGVASGAPIVDESFEQWRRIMAVNLDGAFLTLRTALRLMARGERGGSAVLLSSITGVKPMAGTAAYGSGKAALAHLARIAALEHAQAGIRVNAVAPGGVDTPIWDKDENFSKMSAEQGREAAIAAFASGTPTGVFSSADQIAAQIGFLLSDEAANITGAVLSCDGGLSL